MNTGSMTKAELVEEVSRVSELTKKHSEVIVDTVFKSIIDALHRGEKIELRGFGSFRLRRREPRKGRNPKTGDKVDVPPKKVPYFKPGKELKELINRDPEAPPPPAEAAPSSEPPAAPPVRHGHRARRRPARSRAAAVARSGPGPPAAAARSVGRALPVGRHRRRRDGHPRGDRGPPPRRHRLSAPRQSPWAGARRTVDRSLPQRGRSVQSSRR